VQARSDRIGRGRSRFRRAIAAVATALGLLLCFGSAAASTESEIVVFGPHGGSHLKLSVKGDRMFVHGWMAHAKPRGCHFAGRRNRAVCSLSQAGGVEVDMGPGGDKVEVLDKLPVPLTIHLGAGSDKFIGNGEKDTCYSEGSRRNRCVGGPGNDICITGNQNSDCVGGPGDDYCQHGAGSDGCWGGRGNDICIMGPGQDGCHGGPGNDRLYGGAAADQLYGGRGYDYCNGQRGWGRDHNCNTGPRR
jgi:hypothetical protein